MKKKNSKKAFTLVELLAVIVILGILLLIAIPNVSKIIETSKKNAFLDATKMAVNAVMTEADLAKSGEDPDEKFYFNESGNFCYFNFKDLDYSSGKLDGAGVVRVQNNNGNYSYSVTATNGKYQINGVSFADLKIENVSDTVTLTEEGINTYESSWNCLSPSTPTASTTPATPAEETIVATWPGHEVTFMSADGSTKLSGPSKVFEGEMIPAYRPTASSVVPSGKMFKCWSTQNSSVAERTCYNETTPVTADLTLYAIWQDAGSGGSSGGSSGTLKCVQYELLSFPNKDGGTEDFYVVDGGMSSNELILLSKNGLVGSGTNVRQAYSGTTSTSGFLTGTSVTKAQASSYLTNYSNYLRSMGLSVKDNGVRLFDVELLSYYCQGVKNNIQTLDINCSTEADTILKLGELYWTDIVYSSGSTYYSILFHGKATDCLTNSANTSSYAVRPVVILNRSSVSQCN